MRFANISAHSVYLPPLQAGQPTVLDLGANEGEFCTWAATALSAKAYAVEALPELAAKLATNPLVQVAHAAVAGESGTTTIFRSHARCASAVLNARDSNNAVEVPAVTLEDLCDRWQLRAVDLVKIDIEGSELSILQTSPPTLLQSIGQITCEFHDFIDPSHRPAIRLICNRLEGLGFIVIPMAITTYGDTLFINRSRLSAPMITRLECVAYKYGAAARRLCRRFKNNLGCRRRRLTEIR